MYIPAAHRFYWSGKGSAGILQGCTLLISIFADDRNTRWDHTSMQDIQIRDNTLLNLRIATEYLSKQVARYGRIATFYYDWRLYRDLGCIASFTQELVRADGFMYEFQRNWLAAHFPLDALQAKYRADNIIFLFFFNTDFSNQIRSGCLSTLCSPQCYLETCNMYVRFNNTIMPPAGYAHEILHAFGAPDLYYANPFIPQAYVDHCISTRSNDIMFTVTGASTITNEFSDIDAYYVGLAARPPEADMWGLARSQHEYRTIFG